MDDSPTKRPSPHLTITPRPSPARASSVGASPSRSLRHRAASFEASSAGAGATTSTTATSSIGTPTGQHPSPFRAPPASTKKHNIEALIRQSPPLDLGAPVDDAWLRGKTVLLTGGASGFGAGCVRRWAAAGAIVVFGDVNVKAGKRVEAEARKAAEAAAAAATEKEGQQVVKGTAHFVRCDVTDWDAQVALFKEAVRLSPHGGIDTVVANAGIGDNKHTFERPRALDAAAPPPPDLTCLDVNLTGTLYTVHLALFYLPRNPGSLPVDPQRRPSSSSSSNPFLTLSSASSPHRTRDRHLMLMGSVAALGAIPGQALYGASKHAVLGVWRCLRATAAISHGVRCSLVLPYFVDTPIIRPEGRVILAGGVVGRPEDVVEAMTRFAADPRVVGRAVCVGPKLNVPDEAGRLSLNSLYGDDKRACFEVYAADFEDVEVFTRRLVGVLNYETQLRGKIGIVKDVVAAIGYAFKAWWNSP